MGLWDFIKQLLRLAFAAWWNKVTENYFPRPETPHHILEYPKEYTRDYFRDGFQDYRWTPAYMAPENHLYDNRFKYSKQNYKYVI
jgi:hypothetical protein